MSQKKMTPIIAKALAEKVRAQLTARNKGTVETLQKKVESSKLYKELILTISKIADLEEKKETLKTQLENSFSTKISDVNVSVYGQKPRVFVNYHAAVSVESIKDMILIEDYMSENTLSSDEFIDMIVDKLSNS